MERVTKALSELQLPFDGTSVVPAIEALAGIIFESHTSDTKSALVDADDVAQGRMVDLHRGVMRQAVVLLQHVLFRKRWR